MKKTILTVVVALFCLSASAQYRVMSNVNEPAEGESWGVENFTDNVGIGYDISEDIMVGVQKNGDDYDFIGRYNLKNDMYFSVQMPTENSSDNVTLGVGMSIHVWDKFYVEPNYTRKDEEEGFNVGLSYKL
jgi:opacity protein-like surface antigen|tara:strand:+ start:3950 stop:4342 length:393 start_codon:yes stop_codon:yes gene_type:complete